MATINLTGLPKAMRISGSAMAKIAETLSSERNSMLLSLAVNYVKLSEESDADLDLDSWDEPYSLITRKYPKWKCNIRGDIMEMETDLCLDPAGEGRLLKAYFYEQLGEDVKNVIKKMTAIPSFKDFSATFRFELYPVIIKEKTVQDVINSMADEQKRVMCFMAGQAIEDTEKEVKRLSVENAELREMLKKIETENTKLHMEANRLSAENAELREKLDQKPTGLMVTAKMDRKCAMEIYDAMVQKAFSRYEDTHNHRKLSTQVKKIVSNPKKRTTVILWKNGDKTITKAMKGEKFDAEKGIAMAFMKYAYGNNGAYMKEIRKAIAKDQKAIAEGQK